MPSRIDGFNRCRAVKFKNGSGPSEEVVIDVRDRPRAPCAGSLRLLGADQIDEAYTGVYSVDGAGDCS